MIEKDELDVLLDQWRNTPEPDPHIKQRIWARIAAQDGAMTGRSRPGPWLVRAFKLLSQPLGASAFLALCILLGIAMAEFRISKLQKDRTEELARNYMALIESEMPLGQEGGRP